MRSLYKNNMTILYLGFSLDNLTIFCFSVFCLIISSAKKIGRPFLANLPTYHVPFQSLNALPTYLPKMGTSLMDVPLCKHQKLSSFCLKLRNVIVKFNTTVPSISFYCILSLLFFWSEFCQLRRYLAVKFQLTKTACLA